MNKTRLNFTITAFFLILSKYGYFQNNPHTLSLMYVTKNHHSSIVDENSIKNFIKNFGDTEDAREIIGLFYIDSEIESHYYLHVDTLLIINSINGVKTNQITVRYAEKDWAVKLDNGMWIPVALDKIQKTINLFFKKSNTQVNELKNIEINSRKLKKQEQVNNYNCEIWEEQNLHFQYESKTWVSSQKELIYPLPEDCAFTYKGQLIIKSELRYQNGRSEFKELKNVDTIEHFSIKHKIEELLNEKKGMSTYYDNIQENKRINCDSLIERELVPDFTFKQVKNIGYLTLDSLLSNTSYLLIDIWASWCGPCIKAFPELQKLKKEYGDSLQILSLNYADTDILKINNVLTRQLPSWPQGFASHQLHDLLNPMRMYPSMVLIDRNRKVVMMGKPDLSLNEIRTFLDEHIIPRK